MRHSHSHRLLFLFPLLLPFMHPQPSARHVCSRSAADGFQWANSNIPVEII